ncbi:MAG: response regulator [Leptospiraceae bacterium]|nr:response regulator [Leptospiraceae bacterium]MCZ8345741.1 response regulator [Leptospiraceae bacterium]PJE01501.1 MAG: response regulator [Leptospira sp.]
MNFGKEKDQIFFLIFYSISLVIWIIEEVYMLLQPADAFDRYRLWIASIETLIVVSSFILLYQLFHKLRLANLEMEQAQDLIREYKVRNQFLNNPEKGYSQLINAEFEKWKFTNSEVEIAILILRGFSNQQIASVRDKSLRTIENQTFAIYQKSGMRGKLEFISYFISPLLPEED